MRLKEVPLLIAQVMTIMHIDILDHPPSIDYGTRPSRACGHERERNGLSRNVRPPGHGFRPDDARHGILSR